MVSILASIVAIVMTWTVQSKSLVTGDGQWPYDIEVNYSNTYQKGDVRAGDDAVLSLGNLGNLSVQSIEVWVKSNKSSGAGVFTVNSNGKTVATKSGTFKEWTGDYDNTNYHPIELLSSTIAGVNELVISLHGTENSLHIDRYVITYSPPTPHTVTLMNCGQVFGTLTEEGGGAGVVLPSGEWADSEYSFFAWSETEFWSVDYNHWPVMHEAQERFYPHGDCILYAVYEKIESHPQEYITELEDDILLYVNSESHLALSGVPSNGIMNFATVDAYDDDQHYLFQFTNNGTQATITHERSGTPIGYTDDAKLTAAASTWEVYHDGEETLLYAMINNKPYVLWLNIADGYAENVHAGLLQTTPGSSPMRLQSTLVNQPEIIYTCHPETEGITTVNGELMNGERIIMHFGNYELRVVNGRKELQLKE